MYEVGDLIVYGRTGICEVTEITTLKMDGVPKVQTVLYSETGT